MEFAPSEYSLIKCMQKINREYESTGKISNQDLKKFCISVLKTDATKSRFAAMYESCYDKKLTEQGEFYKFSRKIDEAIVSKMETAVLFRSYDKMMIFLLDTSSNDRQGHPMAIRYDELRETYSRNKSFRFKSILILEKSKEKKKAYKFDPANLM